MVSKSTSKSSNTSINEDNRTAAQDGAVAAQDIHGGVSIISTPEGAFDLVATGFGQATEIIKAGITQQGRVIDVLAETRGGSNSKLIIAVAALAAVALVARG